MSNNSKKHHYLPQFYLRGFTNEDGTFTIYDKQLKIFRKSRPENEFYEKHKNTIDIKGEKSLFVEHMYSHLESTLAPALASVQRFKHNEPIITADLIVRLKFFIESIRWRNPALDDIYSQIITRFRVQDFGLIVKGVSQDERDRIEKELIVDPSMQKILRPLIGMFSLLDPSTDEKNIHKWHILYQDGGFPIIGDFPAIFNPKGLRDNNNREVILPLSSSRTIIHADIRNSKQLPDTFTLDKDLAIMHLSRRFICCKREDYLRFMVNFYYQNINDLEDKFFEDIFNNL